jgi:plastocyanin
VRGRAVAVAVAVAVAAGVVAGAVGAQAAGAHPGHGPATVNVANFAFTPANIVVGQGDVVAWYFSSAIDRNHSVTTDTGQADPFDSDPETANPPQKQRFSVYSRVFRKLGRFTYFCKNHSGMRGSVEVRSIAGSVDNVPPTLSRARLSRRRGCSKSRRGCRTTKAVLSFDLSEPADVLARVQRRRHGRWRTARTFDVSGRRGRNRRTISFRGLAAGAYRVRLKGYDAGGLSSGTAAVRFRVRPGS